MSAAQAEFLGTVDRLIDATEEITTREQREKAPFPYRRRAATGGRRSTPQSMYEFDIVGRELPTSGDFVRIPETRRPVAGWPGPRVVRHRSLRPARVVGAVAGPRCPGGRAELRRLQQAAAGGGGAPRPGHEEPGLLAALVEHRVRDIPDTTARPREQLDPEQLTAFRKALTTEDILVVLGPPGTGKTRTITEIAHTSAVTTAAGAAGSSSPPHQSRGGQRAGPAARDLVVVRVGNEHEVHPT
ncbi:AAA domain-containing protein [Streptomyces sp. M19]